MKKKFNKRRQIGQSAFKTRKIANYGTARGGIRL